MTRRVRTRLVAAAAMIAIAVAGFAFSFAAREPSLPAADRVATTPPTTTMADGFAPRFELGVSALREGDAHAALRAFEAARQMRPHVPEVHVNLGFALLALDAPGPARQAFSTAIALRPRQTNAYFGLAESHERLGDIGPAIGAMRTYLHLAPEADAYRRRALAALWEWQAKRTDAAPQHTTHTLTQPPPTTVSANPAPAANGISNLTFETFDGAVEQMSKYAGKTVLLNVWSAWCAPCRAELPALQRLSEALDPDRVVVLGLSIDEDGDFVREYLRDIGVRYANYIDGTGREAQDALEIDVVPQTFVIDPEGVIRERFAGYVDWDDPKVREEAGVLARRGSAETARRVE